MIRRLEELVEAVMGYCTVDDISLPRVYTSSRYGRNGAPKLSDRIPIVILADDLEDVSPELRNSDFTLLVPATTLTRP